jgi:regulatory protein YycI of two-component signal transduction system YycFG
METFIIMFVIIAVVLELLFFLSHYDKHRNKVSKRKYEYQMLEPKLTAKISALTREVELLETKADETRHKLSGVETHMGIV